MDRDAWDARYREAQWVWSLTPNRFVAEHLADLPPGRALDLACGEGRNALWLAARGWRVTAVDFSQVALDKGRQRADQDGLVLDWVAADATAYEPAAGSFDLVVVAYFQLPADQLAPVLRRAAAALAAGGTMLIVGHDAANLAEGAGGPQDSSVLYTAESIAAVLASVRFESARPGSTGLESLRVERAERVTRPVEGAPRPAVDTLVLARRG